MRLKTATLLQNNNAPTLSVMSFQNCFRYSDSYQNQGSKDDFYNAASSGSNDSRRWVSDGLAVVIWHSIETSFSKQKEGNEVLRGLRFFCRKPSDDWGWNEENWSDTTSKTNAVAKKSVKKQAKESANNDDLLIDFGSDKNKAKKSSGQQEDSWASWENDAWDSLNKWIDNYLLVYDFIISMPPAFRRK